MRTPVALIVAMLSVLTSCSDDPTSSEASTTTTSVSSEATTTTAPASVGFVEEDVMFPSPAGFDLAGTLSVPIGDGPFPGVVLVTGSGPQDRDETLGRHKPFRDIAHQLASHGILVLRFDDRGFGESGGEFAGATTFDFAEDARGAIEFLDSRPEATSLGIVGHSEGGVIAPITAGDSPLVEFVVLLAGTAVVGHEVLSVQQDDVMRTEGVPDGERLWQLGWITPIIEAAGSDISDDQLETLIRETLATATESRPESVSKLDMEIATPATVQAFLDPWMRAFLAYDPVPALESLEVPTLAVLGERDVQVPPALNEAPLRAALAANPDAEVVVLEGLNHLFLEAETGAVSEYEELSGTTAESLLELVTDWILGLG